MDTRKTGQLHNRQSGINLPNHGSRRRFLTVAVGIKPDPVYPTTPRWDCLN